MASRWAAAESSGCCGRSAAAGGKVAVPLPGGATTHRNTNRESPHPKGSPHARTRSLRNVWKCRHSGSPVSMNPAGSAASVPRGVRGLGSKHANVSVAAAPGNAQTFHCLRVSTGEPFEDTRPPRKPSRRAGSTRRVEDEQLSSRKRRGMTKLSKSVRTRLVTELTPSGTGQREPTTFSGPVATSIRRSL